jgi:hypothetical protein
MMDALRDWIFGKADPVAADRKRTINELSEFMKLLAADAGDDRSSFGER